MPLHCRIWIRNTRDFNLPDDAFALVEVGIDNDGDYYSPIYVHCLPGSEVKFRIGQIVRRYEKTRHYPFIVVCSLRDWLEPTNYDILETLPEIRTWKCMVNWTQLMIDVTAAVKAKWPQKVAGYDGSETPG